MTLKHGVLTLQSDALLLHHCDVHIVTTSNNTITDAFTWCCILSKSSWTHHHWFSLSCRVSCGRVSSWSPSTACAAEVFHEIRSAANHPSPPTSAAATMQVYKQKRHCQSTISHNIMQGVLKAAWKMCFEVPHRWSRCIGKSKNGKWDAQETCEMLEKEADQQTQIIRWDRSGEFSLHTFSDLTFKTFTCKMTWWHSGTHTHTRSTALCPGLPGWAGTRKVKPIWILLKQ